jgi:hypothetical protein
MECGTFPPLLFFPTDKNRTTKAVEKHRTPNENEIKSLYSPSRSHLLNDELEVPNECNQSNLDQWPDCAERARGLAGREICCTPSGLILRLLSKPRALPEADMLLPLRGEEAVVPSFYLLQPTPSPDEPKISLFELDRKELVVRI